MDSTVERHLSRDLEELIEFMTNPDGEDDELPNDEGIEKDAKDGTIFSDVISVSWEQIIFQEASDICGSLVE